MGYADFIVSFFGPGLGTNNYTGVRDLFKPDSGDHYPCWDVLAQCSLDGTAGTMDLLDRTNDRSGGVSSSSWNRKLITGDKKDSEITNVAKKVLFAYGKDDQFTYHSKAQHATCEINFFTGDVDCGTGSQVAASYV